MRSVSVLFLLLLVMAPLASAKWVRFEAENAILSAQHAEIRDYPGVSGGKAVYVVNTAPNGYMDFVVKVREPNSLGTPMRVGFYSEGNNGQKLDDYFVNNMTTAYKLQSYACGYYWDPDMGDLTAKYEDFRDSITTYGSPMLFQVISRWWPWWDGPGAKNVPMTVPLVSGTNVIRIQSHWSNSAYDFIELDLPEMAFNPDPADGDTEVRSTQTTLSWQNPAGVTVNRVYFGQSETEPNDLNYLSTLTTVFDIPNPGQNPVLDISSVGLQDGKNYYWAVDGHQGGTSMPAEPNLLGAIWHFATQFNAAPEVSISAPVSYLGQDGIPGQVTVLLDAAVTDDGLPNPPGAIASYAWTYVSGAGASASKTAAELTALEYWWGSSSLNSATVDGDACRYSVQLSGDTQGWGEELRLVNYSAGGLQAGETWKQRFANPADNLYSVKVKMYYTVQGAPEQAVEMVLDPGTEAVLALPISHAVQWHGVVLETGFNVGTYPTFEGAAGTLVIDAYHVDAVLPVIHSPATEDTTVTLYEEGNPYIFQLTASDGARQGVGTVRLYVGSSPCRTSLMTPGNPRNVADINGDCLVNMKDFAALASDWLNCLDTVTGNNCN
jgi:hypothetical protein